MCSLRLKPGNGLSSPVGSRVPWLYAYDGAELGRQLEQIGLLRPEAQQREV